MHVLALIVGGWFHLVGDVGLCAVSVVVAHGRRGFVFEEFYEYPSRLACMFELLPIPLGLSAGGMILAMWGAAGF